MTDYKQFITTVPDFPKLGVQFKDISGLAAEVLPDAARDMLALCPPEFDFIAGIESRGFVFGAAMAALSGKGLVMVRKKGKLPPPVESLTYSSEYSTETLEVKRGAGRVVIVDDCAALGNTFKAAAELLTKAGYEVVGKVALFRIMGLPGDKTDVKAVFDYE